MLLTFVTCQTFVTMCDGGEGVEEIASHTKCLHKTERKAIVCDFLGRFFKFLSFFVNFVP